jgi:hypothetical protein
MKTEREVVRACVMAMHHQFSLLVDTPLSKNALRRVYKVLMRAVMVNGGISTDKVREESPTNVEWEEMQGEFNDENPDLSLPLIDVNLVELPENV